MNKVIIRTLLAGAAFSTLLLSCKKNNSVVDKDVTPPSTAKFNVVKAADTAQTYYVRSTGETFKIPIGVSTVSNVDRKIQLCYTSSSAVAGQQYNAPTTFTIPAGKAQDTLVVQGLYAGYPSSSRIDVLTIRICGGDVPVADYQSRFVLTMRKYCDVVLSALAGNYANAIDNGNYGPYPVTVTAGTSTGTTGFITVGNLWDPGPPVTTRVDLDWTNPAAFTATIPDQAFPGGANWWIKGTTAGTFSSCDQSFTLRYQIYNKSTGTVLYNNQVTVIKR